MNFAILLPAAASLVSMLFLRQAVVAALARPSRFPSARWDWPDAAFSGGLAGFFIAMAVAATGRPAVKVDLHSIILNLVLYLAIVVLIVGFLFFRGIRPVKAFGLRWVEWRDGMRIVLATLALVMPFIYLAQAVVSLFAGPDSAPQHIVIFLLENTGWRERAAVFLVAVVAAPVTEELLFRGCLYGILRGWAGRAAAVVGTSILFALIHGHAPSLPGLFVLAVALALVYERTGSLWAPIALHATFNGITVIAAITWPQFAQ